MPSLYGIIDGRDLLQPVNAITETNLAEAMRYYLQLYTGALNQLLGDFTFPTTLHQERFRVGADAGELDPSDEYSRGLQKRRPVTTYFDVAYPIKQWDDRVGWTQLFLAKSTGERVQEDLDASTQRDRNTMVKEVLRSFMYSANYTWQDDEWGPLAIKRLVNADGTVPPSYGVKTFDGTHNHYLGTGGALTAAFFTTVYNHLVEHGHNNFIVVELARNLEATVRSLTGFYPATESQDNNIIYAAGTAPTVSRTRSPRAIGRINNMEIRLHDFMPDNYGFATDLGSPAPVAMRQDEQAELQGYRMVQDDPNDNYPLRNAFFQRRAGFGVRNRTNGLAFYVNGTTGYTDPVI